MRIARQQWRCLMVCVSRTNVDVVTRSYSKLELIRNAGRKPFASSRFKRIQKQTQQIQEETHPLEFAGRVSLTREMISSAANASSSTSAPSAIKRFRLRLNPTNSPSRRLSSSRSIRFHVIPCQNGKTAPKPSHLASNPIHPAPKPSHPSPKPIHLSTKPSHPAPKSNR